MPDTSRQEIKLFYCYAHEDRGLRDQFETALAGLKRFYHLGNWYDREILAGQEWEEAITHQLNSADIIFLLISPDFMASDYCYGKEMQRALQRHTEGNCLVIPILLRPTHWEGEPFGKLQLLPTGARPITRWPDRDDAFQDVVMEISRAIKTLPIHKSKEEWLAEGRALYKVNNFTRAITAYNQAIKRDARYALAYQHRGEANYHLNKFFDAVADLEKAASLDPTLIRAFTWKGDALSGLNQTRKAYAAYAEGLTIAEKTPQDQWNAEFFFYRGEAFYGLTLYSEALTDYEQAIRLDPKLAIAYHGKGLALDALNRYEEALGDHEQAIRLDPNFAIAYSDKGNTLNELNRYEEALVACKQAIRLDSNMASAYYDKGYALNELNRYEEALAAYDQAIRLDPNFAIAYYDKGNILNTLNHPQEAQQAFEKARQLGYEG